MPITTLPTPPTRQDPTNFADRADTFLAALPTFGTEANALATEVNGYASNAQVAATNAQAAATAAQASAGVTLWNAGTTYTVGQTVYSPTSFFTYRRKLAGQTATDPASDSTNWAQVTGTGNVNAESTLITFTGSVGVNLTNNSARLGIGTNTPLSKLQVIGPSSEATNLSTSVSLSSLLLTPLSSSNWSLSFGSASGNIMYLQNVSQDGTQVGNGISLNPYGGNVGIGVTSPTQKLEVDGGILSKDGYFKRDIDGYLTVATKTTGVTGNYGIYYSSSSASLQLWTASNERMRITETGRMGIGLSSPSVKLHVLSEVTDVIRAQSSTSSSVLSFQANNTTVNPYIVCSNNDVAVVTNSSNSTVFASNGNVGLGVTSPSSKLHVAGSFAITGPIFVSTSTYTVPTGAYAIRFEVACTVTLPSASAFPGRILMLSTTNANAIVLPNGTNGVILPLNSTSGTTNVLPATAGKCVTLQSDGTNWIAIAGN